EAPLELRRTPQPARGRPPAPDEAGLVAERREGFGSGLIEKGVYGIFGGGFLYSVSAKKQGDITGQIQQFFKKKKEDNDRGACNLLVGSRDGGQRQSHTHNHFCILLSKTLVPVLLAPKCETNLIHRRNSCRQHFYRRRLIH